MVHPSELLRNDSRRSETVFEAPRDGHIEEPVECGPGWCPVLARKLNRFAKAPYFIAVIAVTGILQGATKSYLRNTATIWQEQYTFPPNTVDWLLLSSDIFQGIFALLVSFWAVKFNRINWLGVLVIYQSVVVFLFIAPEAEHPYTGLPSAKEDEKYLCHSESILATEKPSSEICWTTMFIMFKTQLIFAMANLAFITLGVTYLDDNVEKYNSPAFIGGAICVKFIGEQVGMYSAWLSMYSWNDKIFITPAWLLFGTLLFICGVAITLFPKVLPETALKYAVASILDEATSTQVNQSRDGVAIRGDNQPSDDENISHGFFATLGRLLRNKLLMMNIWAAVMVHTAYFNFDYFSDFLIQSRFHIGSIADKSGYNDPMLSQIASNLMKPIFTAVCILTSGFIIAKIKPRPMSLMMWNAVMVFLGMGLYLSYAFMNCDQHIPVGISTPYCSVQCNCRHQSLPFSPVCTESGVTYFTPCQAGCHGVHHLNGLKVYTNCSCSGDPHTKYVRDATAGPCTDEKCQVLWSLAEVNSVLIAALLGTCIVAHIFINLRAVRPSDKVLALALEITHLGLIPYVAGHLLYTFISDATCKHEDANGNCQFHQKSFGIILSLVTVCIMGIGLILSMIAIVWCKSLNLYNESADVATADDGEEDFEMITPNNSISPDEFLSTASNTPDVLSGGYNRNTPYLPVPTFDNFSTSTTDDISRTSPSLTNPQLHQIPINEFSSANTTPTPKPRYADVVL